MCCTDSSSGTQLDSSGSAVWSPRTFATATASWWWSALRVLKLIYADKDFRESALPWIEMSQKVLDDKIPGLICCNKIDLRKFHLQNTLETSLRKNWPTFRSSWGCPMSYTRPRRNRTWKLSRTASSKLRTNGETKRKIRKTTEQDDGCIKHETDNKYWYFALNKCVRDNIYYLYLGCACLLIIFNTLQYDPMQHLAS